MTGAESFEIPSGSPMPVQQREEVRGRLQLIDIRSLQLYELPHGARVTEIEQSLRDSGVLDHPVIVDPELSLLIDGHHRVQAFERLGLGFIPAFTVDYLSDEVNVRGWSRATDANPAAVQRAFERPGGEPGGDWSVLAESPAHDLLAQREFTDPREGAQYWERLAGRLEAEGHDVLLCTEDDALRLERIHSYIAPVIGKAEVIGIIDSGEIFPHEVNRHLVADRPLGLQTPLSLIETPKRFQRYVEERVHSEQGPLLVDPGLRQGERVYEEPVTLFRESRSES